MRRRLAIAAAAAVLAAVAAPALAAGPNDDFAGAAPLWFDEPAVVDVSGGGVEVGEPVLCASEDGAAWPAEATHWWTFTGTGRGVTLSTEGSGFDTALALHASFGERLACVDRSGGGESLAWDTDAGARYWVQLGCAARSAPCVSEGLTARVTATSARPANDARAAAAVIAGGSAAGDTHGAGTEEGETVSCGPPFGRTAWYRWTAPASGVVRVSVTGPARGAVALYRAAEATPVACATAATADEALGVEVRVAPGTYDVQVGVVAGASPPSGVHVVDLGFTADPAQVAPAGTPGPVAVPRPVVVPGPRNRDRDGDGTVDARDCRPDDPRVHPAARDVPGDGIDSDCTGADAAWPVLAAHPTIAWARTRSGAGYVRRIEILRPRAGTRVVVRCRRGTCGRLRPVARTLRRSTIRARIALGPLRDLLLAPGTLVEVRLTRRDSIGLVRTIVFRSGRRPRSVLGCLRPRTGERMRCPPA